MSFHFLRTRLRSVARCRAPYTVAEKFAAVVEIPPSASASAISRVVLGLPDSRRYVLHPAAGGGDPQVRLGRFWGSALPRAQHQRRRPDFGADIDYAMLIKLYGEDPAAEKRYSPAQCIGTDMRTIQGNPDPAHVSTSYVERQNLTMRMSMRRYTRLTNAFSKKVQNLESAVALHFMYYNFARIHQTLRVTPAMEAGVSDHVWSLEEIVGLLEPNAMEA